MLDLNEGVKIPAKVWDPEESLAFTKGKPEVFTKETRSPVRRGRNIYGHEAHLERVRSGTFRME